MTNVITHFDEPEWSSSINIDLLSTQLRDWLYYPGSFVERLKQRGLADPVITVLKHDWDAPLSSERTLLQLGNESPVLVREVLIKTADRVLMYARTIFPAATLTDREQVFLSLKDQSLGSILFSYSNLQRSAFEFACLKNNSAWHKKIAKWVTLDNESLWSRRSIFNIENKSILLTEVFLPVMQQL